jgi:hypothetical protein
MMIDMNGPGIETVDEVKALILESVNVWKNFKKRVPSRGIQAARGPCDQPEKTRNVYSQLSGLEDWFSMISARMISFQKVMVKSRQVLYPFLTL